MKERAPCTGFRYLQSCPNLESLRISQCNSFDVLAFLPPSLIYFKLDEVCEINESDPHWMPNPSEWVQRLSDPRWCPQLRYLRPWRNVKQGVNSMPEKREIIRLCREREINLM
jgi:hypothetical protein